jgi:hypothetical protein
VIEHSVGVDGGEEDDRGVTPLDRVGATRVVNMGDERDDLDDA